MDYLYYILLVGSLVAYIAGIFGSVVLWKKMAFFGDTLAHSTLLVVGMAICFNLNVYFFLLLFALLMSLILSENSFSSKTANDTVLAILSHGSLALGLILISLNNSSNMNTLSYLYGDILTVNHQDLMMVLAISILLGLGLYLIWPQLLMIIISEELAHVDKINVKLIKRLFIGKLAILVAFAMKLVGALLITALLIIPAATVRNFSNTPFKMAIFSGIFATLMVNIGIFLAYYLDLPTGPTIVTTMVAVYLLQLVVSSYRKMS